MPTPNAQVTFTDLSSSTDGSINSWHWDFGDSKTSDVQSPPPHVYAQGTYKVTLTVKTSTGLKGTIAQSIDVYPATMKAQPTTYGVETPLSASNISLTSTIIVAAIIVAAVAITIYLKHARTSSKKE
jgi:PKD repeat protein